MAKELPFFKFEVSEWAFGRIQKQPLQTQGVFINLCCKYWHKLGELSWEDACLDFGEDHMNALENHKIIGMDGGFVFIKFLDKQLDECQDTSNKNRIAGLKSAEARAKRKSTFVERSPTGVQRNSTEEKRIDEKRVDEKENQRLYAEVNAFLQRKNPNTMDVAFMVQQWQKQGITDIMPRLKAMKAYYTANDWKFPTKIETLTQSLLDADWTEKLKELNPERKAETVANLKYIPKPAEHDTIGTSAPGSLE